MHPFMANVPGYQLFRTFLRIGLLSFGGPAAQISLMHTELVDRHKWLTEKQFLGALSFCMLLPGPEAMQLATYAGWRLRGVSGGLIAGLLFVMPGALVILLLASGYAFYGQVPVIQAVFVGIKAAVVVIVLQALLSLSRRALTGRDSWILALLAFGAMFFIGIPFPAIIATAAIYGYLSTTPGVAVSEHEECGAVNWYETIKTIATWASLWAAPVVAAWLAGAAFLTEIAVFFSQLAIVTFGGAYAVLAYMTQAVVETHGWLSTEQMIDALGLAETTPGPLILVTVFVGFLAGFAQDGAAIAAAAAAMTLWVTFTPCFLWIFAGAPYVERLLAQPRLKGALAAVSAAVVGVILNLSVWFALHVLFAEVGRTGLGPRPDISSFSPLSAVLVLLAAVLLLWFRVPMLVTLLLTAAAAGAAHMLV
ncbi:chromate efflux transporter [Roseovarius sp. TE539]|uniref:chromate efflux transporter n=1 Tax=Roseovarius sp. TE539 TaxID=2249812 RepID=UPI0026986264